MPILADCALADRTNYVRILIQNNADVKEAVTALPEIGATNAVKLIEQILNESDSEHK